MDEGSEQQQDGDYMRRVWGPIADGAWYLHKHAADMEVFMLYSSLSSLLGIFGQENYSAANSYLDELARWRVWQGLPGVSIQWPAPSGMGMGEAAGKIVQMAESQSVGEKMIKQVMKQLLTSSFVSS